MCAGGTCVELREAGPLDAEHTVLLLPGGALGRGLISRSHDRICPNEIAACCRHPAVRAADRGVQKDRPPTCRHNSSRYDWS